MLDTLLAPFHYHYLVNALFASALVGAVCAFLSAYLMLTGWSLIGDALSHSVVPGVAGAYALGLPYSIGACVSGFLAAISIVSLKALSHLKEDAIIGFIFTTFFAAGLLLISVNPTPVDVDTIILGNILTVPHADLMQTLFVAVVSLAVLILIWKDLRLVFFDETHASTVGVSPVKTKGIFFTILVACTIASLQTVGAVLVIATVIVPGVTAYLLTDRFGYLLCISITIGVLSGFFGTYLSYFLNGSTGGVIVLIQTTIFVLTFIFAPKYGLIAAKVSAEDRIGNDLRASHE